MYMYNEIVTITLQAIDLSGNRPGFVKPCRLSGYNLNLTKPSNYQKKNLKCLL